MAKNQGWHNYSHEHSLAARGIATRFKQKMDAKETYEERQARFNRFIGELTRNELFDLKNEMDKDIETWTQTDLIAVNKRIAQVEAATKGIQDDVIEHTFMVIKGRFEPTERSIRLDSTGFGNLTEERLKEAMFFLKKLPHTDRTEDVMVLIKIEFEMRAVMKKNAIKEEKDRGGFVSNASKTPDFSSDKGDASDIFGSHPETIKSMKAAGKKRGKKKRKGPKFPLPPEAVEKLKKEQEMQSQGYVTQ